MRIIASSAISYQPSFGNPGFSEMLDPLIESAALIATDYSAVIPPLERRRMTDVVKMGIACTHRCLNEAGVTQPGAIVVGTSMGSSIHTRTFLDKILAAGDSALSPTSFILSPHNTIAGQISLFLKNHAYNNTHTHNSLSFEQALMDAMMCVEEGKEAVLVGAADEHESSLFNMRVRLQLPHAILASGAAFFLLSETSSAGPVSIVDVASERIATGETYNMIKFLSANSLVPDDIDLILFSQSTASTIQKLSAMFEINRCVDFQSFSGTWFTNSAFAMAFAYDVLCQPDHRRYGNVKRILIFNNLVPRNFGLILLEKAV